jgi:hypothetical protein
MSNAALPANAFLSRTGEDKDELAPDLADGTKHKFTCRDCIQT